MLRRSLLVTVSHLRSARGPRSAGGLLAAGMTDLAPAVSYITGSTAASIDEELMGPLGFSLDQLMELAGLSCAAALADAFPLDAHGRVLIVAGPGNNGGDGLVMARHLFHFGYDVNVYYPKRTDRPIFRGLMTQLESLDITALTSDEFSSAKLASDYDVIVDAVFGFSFKGDVRAPFDAILPRLQEAALPIVSIDIPSGWSVDGGDIAPCAIEPSMLISLTAPKLCAQRLKAGTRHYLGGRFVPPSICARYALKLPAYPGVSQAIDISRCVPAPAEAH